MSSIDLGTVEIAAPRAAGLLRRLWEGPRSPAGRRLAMAAFSAAGAVALGVLYFTDPSAGAHPWFPPCPFHAATGFYCAGCGSTRGLHLLLHGHILAACRMNVLMVSCVPYLACAYLSFAAQICFPHANWANRVRRPLKANWIWLLLTVIMLFWVVRNLPFAPFSSLAPH